MDGKGLYGRIIVQTGFADGSVLAPLHFTFISMQLGQAAPSRESLAAVYRLLRPGGRAVFLAAEDTIGRWKALATSLGLAEADLTAAGTQLRYERPGPDPARDYRSWFGGPLHQNASNNPDFKPPLTPPAWTCLRTWIGRPSQSMISSSTPTGRGVGVDTSATTIRTSRMSARSSR